MSEAAVKPAAAPESTKGGLFGKVTILVLLLVILGGEALVAFFFLPSADEVAAVAHPVKEETTSAEARHSEAPPDVEHEVSEEALKELDLEKYALTIPNIKTGTSYRVDFHLWGVIAAEHEKEFEQVYEHHKHRLREQVLLTARSSEIEDLTDAGLSLMKRRLLEKVNQALGEPVVKSIVISDFSFIEQ